MGICIADDLAVFQRNDAVRILFRRYWVVGDHDDQAVLSRFFQQLHYLYIGFTVQSSSSLFVSLLSQP